MYKAVSVACKYLKLSYIYRHFIVATLQLLAFQKCSSKRSINVKCQKSLGDTFIATRCIESDRPTHSHMSAYLTLTLCAVSQQSKTRSTAAVVSDVCKDAFVCTATIINTTWVHYTHTHIHSILFQETFSRQL